MEDGATKRKWAKNIEKIMDAFRAQQKHRDKLLIAYLRMSQENREAIIDDGTLDGAADINFPKIPD